MDSRSPHLILKKLRGIWQTLRRGIENIAAAEGLTGLQMYVLFGIETGEIVNIGGLCREFHIGHPNASILCKRLEAAGFINRDRSTDDERFVVLTLTEKGVETAKRLRTRVNEVQNIFDKENPEDITKIVVGISTLEKVLDKSLPRQD